MFPRILVNRYIYLKMIFNFRFRFKDEGSMPYNWETLNPMNLVQKMKTMYGNIKGNKGNNFEFKAFEDFMKRVSLN